MFKITEIVHGALLKFELMDEDGNIIGSFKLNPYDVKLSRRVKEVAQYFKNSGCSDFGNMDAIEMAMKLDRDLTEKVSYIIASDVSQSLFGVISATAQLEDGRFFALAVVEEIVKAVSDYAKKRRKTVLKNMLLNKK